MKALDCECGHHLEATDDAELQRRVREHVDEDHPDMRLGDGQIRELVAAGSYEEKS